MSRPTAWAVRTALSCAVLRFIRTLFDLAGCGVQFFGGELVIELLEIDVVPARFELAALEVDVVGAHGVLGRSEGLIVVAVGDHAVLVEAAKIEVANVMALLGSESGCVTQGVNAHVRINRDPAVGSEIDFRPVMVGLAAGKDGPA